MKEKKSLPSLGLRFWWEGEEGDRKGGNTNKTSE